jgi:hypothetical protein
MEARGVRWVAPLGGALVPIECSNSYGLGKYRFKIKLDARQMCAILYA